MSRYALYFTPDPASPWWQAGCRWLGRDPANNQALAQPAVSSVPPLLLQQLTDDARRYGFHATLKAPFRLAAGFDETHLLQVTAAFSAAQAAFAVPAPVVHPLGHFLALRCGGDAQEINALAMRCVSYFDFLRAAPTDAELTRRRSSQLSPREEQLLQRWGYPYTEEEYRFHLTLTDSLAKVDEDTAYALRRAAEQIFDLATPLLLDAISVFKEDAPGLPLRQLQRFPFANLPLHQRLPAAGRLFFLVGSAGTGKDSLLAWVKERLPQHKEMLFASRTVAGPSPTSVKPGQEHIAPELYWQLASEGHFAMSWQSHDLCYGIRRGFEADLKAGRDVLIDGGRDYLPQLLQNYPDAMVIWLETESGLQHRPEERSRETGPALLKRMQHSGQSPLPQQAQVIRLENIHALESAGQRLLDILCAN